MKGWEQQQQACTNKLSWSQQMQQPMPTRSHMPTTALAPKIVWEVMVLHLLLAGSLIDCKPQARFYFLVGGTFGTVFRWPRAVACERAHAQLGCATSAPAFYGLHENDMHGSRTHAGLTRSKEGRPSATTDCFTLSKHLAEQGCATLEFVGACFTNQKQ